LRKHEVKQWLAFDIHLQQFLQGENSPDNVKFPDNSLTVRGTPAHVKCYSYHAGTSVIVSGGSRNATVHDPKPKSNAETQQSHGHKDAANNKQF